MLARLITLFVMKFYTKRKCLRVSSLCISIKTVEVAFFVTGLETLQILGGEMFTGGSTQPNVRSFEAFLTIYLSIITRNI
jgi:hypothetical protein